MLGDANSTCLCFSVVSMLSICCQIQLSSRHLGQSIRPVPIACTPALEQDYFLGLIGESGKHGPGNEPHYQIGREQPNIITKPSSQVRICESADPF